MYPSKNIFHIVLLSLLLGCATIVRPEGGPKDELPPEVTKTQPEEGHLNFDGKKVKIHFDEFVKSENLAQNMIISPPLATAPYTVDRGKSISIEWYDTLQSDVTYNITFQDVIKDITEGNVMPVYRYVFSTDSIIDSAGFGGYVFDAFTQEPAEDYTVAVYEKGFELDSAVSHIPQYITRTDKTGRFDIRYLKQQTYSVLAFEDGDRDTRYGIGDKVALYLNDVVPSDTSYRVRVDTVRTDSNELSYKKTILSGTPTAADSLSAYKIEDSIAYSPQLFLYGFAPKVELEQAVVEEQRVNDKQILVVFEMPNQSLPPMDNVTFPDLQDGFYIEADSTYDSLLIWITDTTISQSDTLSLAFSYEKTDSLGNDYTYFDTLSFDKKIKKKRRTSRRRNEKITDSVKLEIGTVLVQEWINRTTIVDRDTVSIDTILQKGDTFLHAPVKMLFEEDTVFKKALSQAPLTARRIEQRKMIDEIMTITVRAVPSADSLSDDTVEVRDTMIQTLAETDTLYATVPSPDSLISKPLKKMVVHPDAPVPFDIQLSSTSGITPFSEITLSTPAPIEDWIKDSIKIVHIDKEDSTTTPLDFEVVMPDFGNRSITVKGDWQIDEQYALTIDSAVYFDIFGAPNRPVEANIAGAVIDDLSTIFVNVTYGDNIPVILQLLDEKETMIREQFLTGDSAVVFEYLTPATYIIKVIFDENNNRQWDNGAYLTGRKLPEKVLYYHKKLSLKKNLDIEETWTISVGDNPRPEGKFPPDKNETEAPKAFDGWQ